MSSILAEIKQVHRDAEMAEEQAARRSKLVNPKPFNTLNMVKLGQLYWDDIKNQGLSVGHLISIFKVMWDTSHLTPM